MLIRALLLLIVLLPSLAHAQESQYLIGSDITYGGFGGPTVKVSIVSGKPGIWIGGSDAWFIKHKNGHAISLGGGSYGLATNYLIKETGPGNSGEDYPLNIGYGGFQIGYFNRSQHLVHFGLSVTIGSGVMDVPNEERNAYEIISHSFFVFEPGLNQDLNVTSFFRISTGLSYSLTNGADHFGYNDRDFSGPSGTVAFKFGAF